MKHDISIHALLAESDIGDIETPHFTNYFYPRSPCGERRKPRRLKSRRCVFLSTLSLRRATLGNVAVVSRTWNFYPRSPCGERRQVKQTCQAKTSISIHALLAESDRQALSPELRVFYFYPRSPCGERRRGAAYCYLDNIISIHALLAESDGLSMLYDTTALIFLSTLSLRRATAKVHKTVGHFCAYETNFMEIASSC